MKYEYKIPYVWKCVSVKTAPSTASSYMVMRRATDNPMKSSKVRTGYTCKWLLVTQEETVHMFTEQPLYLPLTCRCVPLFSNHAL